jgi:hypothetical protein
MSDMEKFIEAFQRVMEAVEGIPPEEVQKMIDQSHATIQMIEHRKAKAEKRIRRLTWLEMLNKMMSNLRRMWNNRYANCPVMGVF